MLKRFRVLSISLISIELILISCVPSIPTSPTFELWLLANDYLYEKNDYEKARDLYEQVARQIPTSGPVYASEFVSSQMRLGSMYKYGDKESGFEPDYEKARYWYEQAANQGFASGQYELAKLHQHPYTAGTEQDHQTARYWYEQAANKGFEFAQYELGVIYQEGLGVEQNDRTAHYWYEQAANQDYTPAQSALETLPEGTTSAIEPVQTPSTTSTTNTLQGNIGQANDVTSAIDSITCGNGDFDNLRTILPIYNNIPVLKETLDTMFLGDFQTIYTQGKGSQTSEHLKVLRAGKEEFEQNRDSSIQALNQFLTVDPVAWIAAIDAGIADTTILGDESQGPIGQDALWSRSYLIAQYGLARLNMLIACYEEVE